MRNLGIALIVVGIVLMAITGFNYVTKKKVLDVGSIQVEKEVNHPVEWSPIIGGILLLSGIVIIATSRKAV